MKAFVFLPFVLALVFSGSLACDPGQFEVGGNCYNPCADASHVYTDLGEGTCEECPAGTYKWDEVTCAKCPNGTYSTVAGLVSAGQCTECVAGSYCVNGGMYPCVERSNSGAGAAGPFECVCELGYYRFDEGRCEVCPKGTGCPSVCPG